jgi:hypothetical protein
VARDDANPIARQRERVGEQVDERLVRATAFGRRGDAYLPPLAMAAEDLVPGRARRNRDPDPRHDQHKSA